MEGRCQCGLIQFTTPEPKPIALYICHCTECRHQSASTYGMTALFSTFKLPNPYKGAIGMYCRPNSVGQTAGFFCTRCGVRVCHQTIPKSGQPVPYVSIKSGCLDGITKEMMRGAIHIWTKSAIIDIPEGVEAYEEEPPGGSFKEE